ncbi:hypothetical protein TNCV_4036501 [Trichonephila clavipes]|nr:hypothetical protein TNCV_4036501 [Trichonephila clavipes]
MILCIGRIIGKIEEGAKNNDVARSSTSFTALFHGCGSHLKLLECVVDTRGGRVRSTTPAEDRYIILSAKRNRRTHSSAGGKSVSCCLRKADLPKNCCQTFEEEDFFL